MARGPYPMEARELEMRRDAVRIDGVARNKALKLYRALIDKGELPRQAFDRALRDYIASATPEAAASIHSPL